MKPGRNEPCICGSGKKYKHCCEGKPVLRPTVPTQDELGNLVSLFNLGRHAEVESRARLLLGIYPDSGFIWKLLSVSLHMQGKDPLAALQKAAYLLPDDAGVHNNLGNALQDIGRFEGAASSYRYALKIKPDFADAHNNLGLTLRTLGQLDAAMTSYRLALRHKPDFTDAHNNLGLALQAIGRPEEALASYRYALQLKPDLAHVHNNLGNALKELNRLDDAVASYRRALQLDPDLAEAHNNLGNTLKEFGQLDGAVASYKRALQLKPDFVEAHSNLGNALTELGQFDAAISSLRRALEINPDFADAHYNLGIALQGLGQIDAAQTSYRRALEINPDFVKAHYNLGNVLMDLRNLDGAKECYLRALKIKPDYAEAYSNLLYMHAFSRDISPEMECELAANWENIALSESERIAARNRTILIDSPFDYSPRSGRKLKIGVVSAEIGQHAVAEFLEPFLEQIDRSRFHITLFPTAARQESRAVRLKELADEFKPLIGIPDNKAADLIRAGRIDVLVDTTAHMRGCRLGIFAHRAAPVQCHYIGYHGTTGLTEMDWFIADNMLLPPSCDTHFREGIWRLPRLWIAYRGDVSLPDSHWEPSLDGTVWLGSFNNLTKVREETLALWAKVMNAIPESKLFLKDRKAIDQAIQNRIRMELGLHGINEERVEFASHVTEWRSHMAMYDKLDIALDTIPLNSGTTAFDALWMGVPLVALEGDWMGGRMTSAILGVLGKPEWIAQNEDEYVAIVEVLARDVAGRKLLRATQRTLMAGSPLCDAKGLTRALEDAFEAMFDRAVKISGGN